MSRFIDWSVRHPWRFTALWWTLLAASTAALSVASIGFALGWIIGSLYPAIRLTVQSYGIWSRRVYLRAYYEQKNTVRAFPNFGQQIIKRGGLPPSLRGRIDAIGGREPSP